MNNFFKKKILTPFGTMLLAVIVAAVACSTYWLIGRLATKKDNKPSDFFTHAVADSVFANADEIMPLVTIDKHSDMVTWDEKGEKTLMLSWHKKPERYPESTAITVSGSGIWTFTDREIASWYDGNNKGVTDWTLRLEQLIGLPKSSGYTHVSAFWCETNELIRPAYQTDITKPMTTDLLNGSALGNYKAWFDSNTLWSYFDSAYPWTRLGYTYDWADNGTEYGLSEFLILSGSVVEIEWSMTTDNFLAWLNEKQI